MSPVEGLRDYQIDAITKVYAELKIHQSVILQMPTGSGKTHVAKSIIKHGLMHGKRICFCVDRITLLDQTIDVFIDDQIKLGVVQGDHPMSNTQHPVQVASLQTLARRGSSDWPIADLYIIDEAHVNYAIIQKMMYNRVAKFVGLSATPFTRGLGLVWDSLVVATTTKELIGRGYLSEYEAYGPSTPNLVGVHRSGGDFAANALEERMNVLTGGIVDHYKRMADGMKGLYFTPTVAYAQSLADEFSLKGVPADHVSGHDSEERRLDVLARYKSGEIKVITNCEVLTKGFDAPDIMGGGLCRPTRSLALHIQMLGRFLRTHPDKEKVLILDHSGNIERLGYPDDDLPDTLDMDERPEPGEQEEREERLPWNCPECHHLVPVGTRQCPVCGFIARAQAEVEVKTGILKRLDNPNITERQQKQDVYSQLLDHAHLNGYSPGWVAHKYREIFEVWPRGMLAVRKPVSQELHGWIRHKQIAYAKRKEGSYAHS